MRLDIKSTMVHAARPALWPGRFVSGIGFLLALILCALAVPPAEATEYKPAPEFRLKSLAGTEYSLKDFRGQYVLLNFWATWCGPCKIEMPSLESLHRRFNGRKFTVVGISNDVFGSRVVQPYVEAQHLTFPILLDPEQEISQQYGVMALPTSILIDPEGRIIGILSGAEDWSEPDTIHYFESLLQPPADGIRDTAHDTSASP